MSAPTNADERTTVRRRSERQRSASARALKRPPPDLPPRRTIAASRTAAGSLHSRRPGDSSDPSRSRIFINWYGVSKADEVGTCDVCHTATAIIGRVNETGLLSRPTPILRGGRTVACTWTTRTRDLVVFVARLVSNQCERRVRCTGTARHVHAFDTPNLSK
ncbi:unnamed protein product, partial [Iphiclides podalirius]